MDFKEAVRSVLGQYASFSGRATRSEYWWWVLFTAIVYFACYFLIFLARFIFPPTANAEGPESPGLGATLALVLFVLMLAAMLALLIPSIAVLARRLHDTNRSALWILAGLIPLVGGLILIVLCVVESDQGSNQYGPPAGSGLASEPDPGGDPQAMGPDSTDGSDGAQGHLAVGSVPSGDNQFARQRARVRPDLPHMPTAPTLSAPQSANDELLTPTPAWSNSSGSGGEPQPTPQQSPQPSQPTAGPPQDSGWPQPPAAPGPPAPPPPGNV